MPFSIILPAVAGAVVNNVVGDIFAPDQPQGQSSGSRAAGAAVGGAVANYLSPADAQKAADAADPFNTQRSQYQRQLSSMMSPGSDSFTSSDPSYNFRFNEGVRAVNLGTAAAGQINSGNRLVELQKYGQGTASGEFDAQYKRLSALSGATTGSPAAAGQILAQQNSQNQKSAGAVGSAVGSAVGGALNGIGGRIFDAFGREVSNGSPGYQGDPNFLGNDGYGGDNWDLQGGSMDTNYGNYGSTYDNFSPYSLF